MRHGRTADSSGRGARIRARYALFLEPAGDPVLGEPLHQLRREFERWTEQIVIADGITDPVPATQAPDGALRRTDPASAHVDPDLDLRPAIERAVRAIAES